MQSECVEHGQTVMIQSNLLDKHSDYTRAESMERAQTIDPTVTTEGEPCGGSSPIIGVTRPPEIAASRPPGGAR